MGFLPTFSLPVTNGIMGRIGGYGREPAFTELNPRQQGDLSCLVSTCFFACINDFLAAGKHFCVGSATGVFGGTLDTCMS